MTDYRDVNRANWDDRAALHAASSEYGLDSYVEDSTLISGVVRFDQERLGDISGLRGVHLQCHIGTDTVSLSRLGAQMTGVDLSPASLAVARDFAARAGADIDFVESDVYSAPDVLGEHRYDLVYTGIGALCWLPDIDRWAQTVARLLVPGGRLFIREGHPILWSMDDERADALVVRYPYFETVEPTIFDSGVSYAGEGIVESSTTHEWNHGIGEIITAVLAHGMAITRFEEHRSVPWDALPGQMREIDGECVLAGNPDLLPLTYTLCATRT